MAHLRHRLLPNANEDTSHVLIDSGRIYPHLTMRINYTTYDVRRDTKLVTLKRSPDIMLAGQRVNNNRNVLDDPHVYRYARVIGIYHTLIATVVNGLKSDTKTRVEFLHVRWYQADDSWVSGWNARRLDRVGFIPGNGEDAFSFVDPAEVISSCQMIPAGSQGKTKELLSVSKMARWFGDSDIDWKAYYVNRSVCWLFSFFRLSFWSTGLLIGIWSCDIWVAQLAISLTRPTCHVSSCRMERTCSFRICNRRRMMRRAGSRTTSNNLK
jgi:hypothetical protein